MFENRLGSMIRITDASIIERLRGVSALDFEKIDGAVIARVGTRNRITYTATGTPGFRRPRFLDGVAAATVRVWRPDLVREHGELFRISVETLEQRPRFTLTRMVIPLSYISNVKLSRISFSSTSMSEFRNGILHGFLTNDKYPMCYRMLLQRHQLLSNRLTRLSQIVGRFGFKLNQYVFKKQLGEDLYFEQDLLGLRGGAETTGSAGESAVDTARATARTQNGAGEE